MTRTAVPFALFAALLAVPAAGQKSGSGYTEFDLTPEERDHWAYKKPVRHPIPAVKAAGVRNPVDSFILAKLEAEGLKMSPEADRRTLLRRVSFDLTGLPPTPAETDAFLKDTSPDAYEKVVDRLLASPHFGERWAQHWLDVVRFAETNGYEADAARPHAWRYRDYVVRSFNADKPYDRFITEQVAGDELWERMKDEGGRMKEDATPTSGIHPSSFILHPSADLLIATGMHRCGPIHAVGGNLDKDVLRQELLTEIVNGFGSAVLGLTMACARCHDHKFDAISQGDYYRLQAFFTPTQYKDIDLATAAEKLAHAKRVAELVAQSAPLKKQVAEMDAPHRAKVAAGKRARLEPKYTAALDTPADKRTPEQKKLAAETVPLLKVTWDEVLADMTPDERVKRAAIREKIHAIEARTPPPPAAAWAIQADKSAPQSPVMKRGDPKRPAGMFPANAPRALSDKPVQLKSRTELAKWLTAPDNPITARVIVNRLWQHHFGRGIVATPNDFGVRGEPPTHPELLDWLASELANPERQRGGVEKANPLAGARGSPQPWQLKRIHRLLVTSAAYRQASDTPPAPTAAKVDPDNHLLWRMNRRRLDAEALRDATLAASGALNRAVGGPSVKLPLEPEVYDLIFTEGEPDGLWPVTPDAAQHARRSLYLFAKRNVRLPMFEAFDQPDTLNSCADRPVSTFAPQALILMNGPFVQEQGKELAVRLAAETADPAKQVDSLYERAVGRPPTADERTAALLFLVEQADSLRDRVRARESIGLPANLPPAADPARVRALADLAVVVFNTNEFVYLR